MKAMLLSVGKAPVSQYSYGSSSSNHESTQFPHREPRGNGLGWGTVQRWVLGEVREMVAVRWRKREKGGPSRWIGGEQAIGAPKRRHPSYSCWWSAGLTSAHADVISPLELELGRYLPSGQPVFVGPTSNPSKSGPLELAFLAWTPPSLGLGLLAGVALRCDYDIRRMRNY
ncbi:unnamed protein product [Prunus armeniaca]